MLKIVSSNTLDDVKKCGLVYLATPYTRYRKGLDQAFLDACRLSGKLIRMGLNIFSPIAHSHSISKAAHMDAKDHALWLSQDSGFMQAAGCMLVAKMDGWSESVGIKHEIGEFAAQEKPIYYLDVDTFEVRR